MQEGILRGSCRRLITLALWVMLGLQTDVTADDNRVSVILLAGQSNAAGRAASADLPADYRKSPGNVRLDYCCSFGAQGGRDGPPEPHRSSGWAPLIPQPKHASTPGPHFGPEIGLGFALSRAAPSQDFVVVKHGRGATSLAVDWKPHAVGGPGLYAEMHRQFQAAMQRLREEGKSPSLVALVWLQGEADSTRELWARAYAHNLTQFLARVRRDFAEPRLPVLIVQTGNGTGGGRMLYAEEVRAAQREVVQADVGARLVTADDLPLMDHVHYSAAAQIELGERIARALLTLPGLSQGTFPSKTRR